MLRAAEQPEHAGGDECRVYRRDQQRPGRIAQDRNHRIAVHRAGGGGVDEGVYAQHDGGDNAAEQRQGDVRQRVLAENDLVGAADEQGGQAIGQGVQAGRVLAEAILGQPDEERAEECRLPRHVQTHEHDRQQHEIRRPVVKSQSVRQPDLQAQGDIADEDVGEPAHGQLLVASR